MTLNILKKDVTQNLQSPLKCISINNYICLSKMKGKKISGFLVNATNKSSDCCKKLP